ncbi:MAG: molybdopterin-binding protein [Candidatus Bathyarchaeota archaeon]|nr:molybdopterin-binding protein [Candidatus Bathyarchaeota archaeon]
MSRHAEILCIGNELLIGKTVNTNATWLAKQATSLGITVKRVTVIGDNITEIAAAVKEALARKPRFLITTGGLGPTFDDMTLEGIAKVLGIKLKVNTQALNMIKAKYEAYCREKRIPTAELTPPRVKMATLPEGAEPLRNSVGTAPGVKLKAGQTLIFILPGVPPEMEAIFEESVAPILRKLAGEGAFFEKSMFVGNIVESSLAPLIDRVMLENPHVYVKSHVYTKGVVAGENGHRLIELHLSTKTRNQRMAQRFLEQAANELAKLVAENGGKVESFPCFVKS